MELQERFREGVKRLADLEREENQLLDAHEGRVVAIVDSVMSPPPKQGTPPDPTAPPHFVPLRAFPRPRGGEPAQPSVADLEVSSSDHVARRLAIMIEITVKGRECAKAAERRGAPYHIDFGHSPSTPDKWRDAFETARSLIDLRPANEIQDSEWLWEIRHAGAAIHPQRINDLRRTDERRSVWISAQFSALNFRLPRQGPSEEAFGVTRSEDGPLSTADFGEPLSFLPGVDHTADHDLEEMIVDHLLGHQLEIASLQDALDQKPPLAVPKEFLDLVRVVRHEVFELLATDAESRNDQLPSFVICWCDFQIACHTDDPAAFIEAAIRFEEYGWLPEAAACFVRGLDFAKAERIVDGMAESCRKELREAREARNSRPSEDLADAVDSSGNGADIDRRMAHQEWMLKHYLEYRSRIRLALDRRTDAYQDFVEAISLSRNAPFAEPREEWIENLVLAVGARPAEQTDFGRLIPRVLRRSKSRPTVEALLNWLEPPFAEGAKTDWVAGLLMISDPAFVEVFGRRHAYRHAIPRLAEAVKHELLARVFRPFSDNSPGPNQHTTDPEERRLLGGQATLGQYVKLLQSDGASPIHQRFGQWLPQRRPKLCNELKKNPQTARKRLADLLDLRNRAEHEVAEMSEDDVKKVLEIARWLLSSID